MKPIAYIFLTATLLIACNSNQDKYIIEGSLYGGRSFEGETIYLVPFENPDRGDIDSAIVTDGHFVFEGTAAKPEICILRMRPMMRLFIEEQILVKEPGHIYSQLSKQSSAKGTAMNDSLQAWKTLKAQVADNIKQINKQIKNSTDINDINRLTQQRDSLRTAFDQTTLETMRRNDNIFGQFLNRIMR